MDMAHQDAPTHMHTTRTAAAAGSSASAAAGKHAVVIIWGIAFSALWNSTGLEKTLPIGTALDRLVWKGFPGSSVVPVGERLPVCTALDQLAWNGPLECGMFPWDTDSLNDFLEFLVDLICPKQMGMMECGMFSCDEDSENGNLSGFMGTAAITGTGGKHRGWWHLYRLVKPPKKGTAAIKGEGDKKLGTAAKWVG